MRKTSFMTALLLLVATSMYAYVAPQAGKVYRIHNVKAQKVIGEDCIARQLMSTDAAGNDEFKQLWVLTENGSGYSIQNAYSGQYIQHNPQSSVTYPTGAQEAVMYITALEGTKYAIGQSTDAYLHLDGGGNVVRWWDKANTASQWQFEEVNVSNEAIQLQQAAFKELYDNFQVKLGLMEHLDEYNALLPTFFADTACTVLKETYATMSDEELRTAMSELPASLQNIAIKVKNNAWGHREQEFRIRDYKAYSDPDYWAEVLYTKKYSRINNPTGIYGNAGDVLYVFVGNDIPEGTTLTAEVISGSGIQGEATTLFKGLNMVPTVKDYSNLFIRYVGHTSLEDSTLITDYPTLKIHVEEGVVNGFWNIEEHTDADWRDMMENLATADVFQVKGERFMFHMSKKYMKQFCESTITDAIGWWDDMTRWQQDLLGIEDVRLSKFNNLGCAISLTTGYQSATHYRTQYLDSYVGNLLPYENMMSNADNCWGPAHENGHVHQAAIQSVGTSEVCNNLFSNLTMNKLGKYLSRGNANKDIFDDYAEHTPYILRDGATTLRSFWQLYLYFHEAKVDTTFYPRVFQAMRATPMKARDPKYYAMSVYANEDLLLFAKACCDVAQLDLSEFFRFWGYMELTNEQHIGDYGDFYLTTRQKDVDEFLAHVSQYPKAPSIVFIEDRVKPIPRTDGGAGDKLYHGSAIKASEAGDVGHYTDFMDTTVKAEGYIYDKDGTAITISDGSGALGFKVYTKNDSLLIYGSNHLSFNLPEKYKMHDIFIVAAQADATDIPVKSRAEIGSESEQLAILEEALTLAKEYIGKADSTGTRIGFFYPESVVKLKELVSQAEYAIQHEDQSVHTYGSWAMLITSATSELYLNPTARIAFSPNCFYSLATSGSVNQYLSNATAGLRTLSLKDGIAMAQQWKLVPAGAEGIFYMQHRETGNYISYAKNGGRAKAELNDIGKAIPFAFVADAPGEFYVERADTVGHQLFNQAGINQVFVGKQNNASARWLISMEDDMLALPDTSTSEELAIYYILNTRHNEYAYQKSTGRDRGKVASNVLEDNADFNYWFYFTQSSEEGKYAIYNYATGLPVTASSGSLYANKKADEAPEYTIARNEEGTGIVISAEEGVWHVSFSKDMAQLSTKDTTLWKLQRARTISLVNEPLTSITLDKTTATLTEGDSIILTFTTAPVYATDHTITWSSNKEEVATVDANGQVKAIAAGKATITATANDGSGVKATCSVTVKAKPEDTRIDAATTTLSVQSSEGVITIDGVVDGTVVNVFDVVGKQIAATIATSSTMTIDTKLVKGNTVIVKIGGQCMKVQIK